MLFNAPKKLKYTRFFKIKKDYFRFDNRYFQPRQMLFGLQIDRSCKLTAVQIESCRLVIRRFFKKNVIIRINVFPFISITRKSTGSRMGKGKGKPVGWVCPVERGRVIFDIMVGKNLKRVVNKQINRVLLKAGKKLPVKARAVTTLY